MKTLLKIFLFSMLTFPVFAQDDIDEPQPDPNAREKIKAAHAAYITEKLNLTPEEAEKFWPIYREFIQKRQDIRQSMREARKNGADEKTLLDLDLKGKQQELDLEKDYSGRLQKIITPQKVMGLRQAEHDFRKLVLRHVQQRQDRRMQLRDRSQQRLQQRNN
jgi:hypothetical protein